MVNSERRLKIALIGNPNCGKSTLFNALTGSHQEIGNWPGVTVARKSGYFHYADQHIELIDLPGVYTLTAAADDSAIDTAIARQFILSGSADVILNIVDASNLERHLYLTLQLLEMQVPMIVAINMLDVAHSRQIQLDLSQLEKQLGCPVIGISAVQKTGLEQLKQAISTLSTLSANNHYFINYPPVINDAILQIIHMGSTFHPDAPITPYLARYWLEGDATWLPEELPVAIAEVIQQQKQYIQQHSAEEADLLIADARYTTAHEIAKQSIQLPSFAKKTLTQRIDQIILNRFLGIPIFLASMYLMFFFSINIGGAFQPFFDQVSDAIFVQGFAAVLNHLHMPELATALLTLGIGKGINTVVTFIPVIGCLFLWLSILESSGYMARAAFVIDRAMSALGLPGKAFVPLIVGFGCNVPAILAARTLEHRRDRLLTMMMSPFMSCGARLAIYAVFTAAFFPQNGQNIVFMLYVIGIAMAVMTGLVLRKTVLKGESSPWVVELPTYHRPTLMVLLRATWHRLKMFLFNAGKYIIPVCFIVGSLNAVTLNGHVVKEQDASSASALSVVGKTITPIFAPMGIQPDNWPATVGLMSGILAKEVVVGTLNTLYAQTANLSVAADNQFNFLAALQGAVLSIPQQFSGLATGLANPIAASAGDADMNASVLGVMGHYFDGQAGAMAYLLFVLLYFPCISATAALARESSPRWALFSVSWTTGLAYIVAVIYYQIATWAQHPMTSLSWSLGLGLLFCSVLWAIRRYANQPASLTLLKPIQKVHHVTGRS